MVQLDHRYQRARQLAEEGDSADMADCPLAQLLVAQMSGVGSTADQNLIRALDFYKSRRTSTFLLEALLLAPDSGDQAISTLTRAPVEFPQTYRKYFFDTSLVLADSFALAEYLSSIKNHDELRLKKIAVNEGIKFVALEGNFGGIFPSSAEIAKSVQKMAFDMVRQSRGAAVCSDTGVEAKGWASILKEFLILGDKLTGESTGNNNFIAELSIILKKGAEIASIEAFDPETVVRG